MPRDQVFISYSHKDKKWLDRFVEFLKPLVRQEDFTLCSDQDIRIGQDWHQQIQAHLSGAKAVVLLISPAFLASDYIANSELPVILKSVADKGVKIFPILIAPSTYERASYKYPDPSTGPQEFTLASIQAANPPSETLIEMNKGKQNRVLLEVADQLADLLKHKPSVGPSQEAAPGATGAQSVPPSQISDLFVPYYDVNLDKQFCGRDWLFDKIKDWTTRAPGLLLLGDPGTGKSAIIAELVKRNKLSILAYHCFDATRQETLKPSVFIHELIARIAKSCPEYKKCLEERDPSMTTLLNNANWDQNPSSYIDRLFLEPPGDPCKLSSLCNLSKKGPHYILLDALDEAVSSGHKYENEVFRGLQGLLRNNLPDQLRIIATSRRERKVTSELHFRKTVDINSEAERLEDSTIPKEWARRDIETYIFDRLNQPVLNDLLRRSQISANEVVRLLTEKADGNFLYAEQALLWLEEQRNFSFEDLGSLPSELESLYHKFFDRLFKGKDYGPTRRLLEVLVAAQAPLTQDELKSATRVEDYELSGVIRRVESYLSKEQGGKYKFYHKSFPDWLTSSKLKGHLYYIDPLKGHEQLADFCFKDYERAKQRLRRPALYTCQYGVSHLIKVRRFAQAVKFLCWLNEHRDLLKGDSSKLVSRFLLFAKDISIALAENAPDPVEAQKIEPDKLASLLRPLYMTEALYGGIDLLVRFHPAAWPKIFKEFMGTEDYVLRYTISEALGEAYRVNKDNEDEGPRRLGEIRGYCESNDIGYQEVGYYAFRYIIAQNPELLGQNDYIQHLLRLANFPTYPGRSILGDLLLNIMLQNKGDGPSFGPDEIMTLGGQDPDHRSRFWNPIWRFQRMDIVALIASYHFVGRKSLLDSVAEDVRSAYSILVRTEERRTHLLDLWARNVWLSRSESMEKVCSLLECYYCLGITPGEQIRADLDGLKDKENRWLKAVFEVLFAHPLWEVIEKAASILASITDDNPRAVEVVKELFVHDIWRVRYGAAETAFLASFDRDRELFSNAVKSFYKEDEPLLRGNCAENLAAWILETDVREERAALLNKYQEQIEFWLKDEDCWVLDHIYRLFRKLAQDKQEADFAFLLGSGISPLLEGDGGVWYRLDRKDFLERIEENKLARTPVDGCPKT